VSALPRSTRYFCRDSILRQRDAACYILWVASVVGVVVGLMLSATGLVGTPGGALSLAWRVEGSVRIVAAPETGDGPRPPAGRRAARVQPLGACGLAEEHSRGRPGGGAQGLDRTKKLLSWKGIASCAQAETKTDGEPRATRGARRLDDLGRRRGGRAHVERDRPCRHPRRGVKPRLAGGGLGPHRGRA
jgi:hypothetical protein